MNKQTSIRVIIVLLLFQITWSCKNEDQAIKIVLNSLGAHGGIEKWENAKQLSYKKTTILYDRMGNIEKKLIQKHINTFKPDFAAEMVWKKGDTNKRVVLNNNQISIFFNNKLKKNNTLENIYRKNIEAANYVIWQPYKLLDPNVSLHYIGQENLDGRQTDVVKASYFNDDGSPANTWWYYFDAKSHKLLGNMVHHGATYSYIRNVKYESKTGLFLNTERKSYMTDSLRNIKFLRAQYYYTDFLLK